MGLKLGLAPGGREEASDLAEHTAFFRGLRGATSPGALEQIPRPATGGRPAHCKRTGRSPSLASFPMSVRLPDSAQRRGEGAGESRLDRPGRIGYFRVVIRRSSGPPGRAAVRQAPEAGPSMEDSFPRKLEVWPARALAVLGDVPLHVPSRPSPDGPHARAPSPTDCSRRKR